MGVRWDRVQARLSDRWDYRADDRQFEARRERARANVAACTAEVLVETAIELPCPREQVWDLLFESDERSPLHVPGSLTIPLPGPPHRQVGHRYVCTHGGRAAGEVFVIEQVVRGEHIRVRPLTTSGGGVSFTVDALEKSRSRLVIREAMRTREADAETWRRALVDGHLTRLGKVHVELTGTAPPPPFAAMVEFADAMAATRAEPPPAATVPVRVVASTPIARDAGSVWQVVRDPTRVGLPSLQSDLRLEIAASGGPPDAIETWVGIGTSVLGTPYGWVVAVVEEVPGRRLVVRPIGTSTSILIEVEPRLHGCTVTAVVETSSRAEGAAVTRRTNDRMVHRYVRDVERAVSGR